MYCCCRIAVTSSRRLRTPTFSKADFRCSWTVFVVMCSRSEISRVDLPRHTNARPLATFAFVCAAVALFAVIMAIRALLAGFTATYVFTNGLVHTKNRKIDVVTWPDIDELLLWKAGGKTTFRGKLLGYYLITLDGRKLALEARSAKGDGTVGEVLQQIVRDLGRPVRDSGPYTGRLRV
jgi:hypothetical protein